MKMFMVANRSNLEPIGFHMEKRVVLRYKEDYERDNPTESLVVIKLKDYQMKRYKDFGDMYLVRYGDSYIPSKFLYIAQLDSEQILYDLNYAHDVINRIIEMEKNEKKIKTLLKALSIIDAEKTSVLSHTYNIKDLKRRDGDYNQYKNQMNFNEKY